MKDRKLKTCVISVLHFIHRFSVLLQNHSCLQFAMVCMVDLVVKKKNFFSGFYFGLRMCLNNLLLFFAGLAVLAGSISTSFGGKT